MPGAAEPACSFELSQLGWGTGSATSRGTSARAGDVDKAKAVARSITDRHERELSDLYAHQTDDLLGVNESRGGRWVP